MCSLENQDIFVSWDVHFYEDVSLLSNNEACEVEEVPSKGGML